MHSITFFNLGNADSTRVILDCGRRILFDYANMRDANDDDDLRCDLPNELRDDLGKRDYFDVVAFSHLDRDHYAGATDFFYFEHIAKYQGDVDGKKRIKMKILWVPAAVITEQLARDADIEAKAIQSEARERFKAGEGIRVFSCPGRLKEWCENNGVDMDARSSLITDAGTLAPEFTLDDDGVEFFVHSPFAVRQDGNTLEDRNCDCLVMQATFKSGETLTKLMLSADVTHDVISDIVAVTESKGNDVRLEWDVFKLPHHCSYKSLSDDKGRDKTKPVPKVKRLFEHYGQERGIVVSTSDTIPEKGDDRDTLEGANPPHRQAANYYREDVIPSKDGEFKVTMEHPSSSKPSPLVITVGERKATVKKASVAATAAAVSVRAPRAGYTRAG
jgi:hypothetical protein